MKNKLTHFSIKSAKEIEFGLSELQKIEPKFTHAVSICGSPEVREVKTGFEALFKIIVGQQLSTTAANSIWKNLIECKLNQKQVVLTADIETLRNCGLSSTKASYVKALALAEINYETFHKKTDAEIINELLTLRGVGLWTAQIYLIFSLQRPDVFACGDLALREGVRALFAMDKRPSTQDLETLSESWRPFRTIASMVIWKYYNYSRTQKSL